MKHILNSCFANKTNVTNVFLQFPHFCLAMFAIIILYSPSRETVKDINVVMPKNSYQTELMEYVH